MTGLEIRILDLIQSLHNPIIDYVMIIFTHIGSLGLPWILLCLYMYFKKDKRDIAKVMIFALIIDLIICNLIFKNIFLRPRPFLINPEVEMLIKGPNSFSFPSGHTSSSFVLLFILKYYKEYKLLYIVLPIAIMIAFSRMYLYVHYPSDIIGGILTAFVSAIIAIKITTYIKKEV